MLIKRRQLSASPLGLSRCPFLPYRTLVIPAHHRPSARVLLRKVREILKEGGRGEQEEVPSAAVLAIRDTQIEMKQYRVFYFSPILSYTLIPCNILSIEDQGYGRAENQTRTPIFEETDRLTEGGRQRTGCSRLLARAWMFFRSLGRTKTHREGKSGKERREAI